MTKEKTDLEKIAEAVKKENDSREKDIALKEAKKKAVERQKQEKREDIIDGDTKLEKEGGVKKKIVQNIKLYEWVGPDRYQFGFNSKSFIIIVALALVFILLLAILGHYWLMATIIALLFFIYVAGTTKPQDMTHTITARGIDTGGKLYEWDVLESFYFANRNGQETLIVETKMNFPPALIMYMDIKEREALFVLLQDKVLYKDIRKQSRLDKLNLGEYIPLEDI